MLNRWNFLKTGFYEGINLGRIADQVFAGPTEHDGLGVVVGMLAFTGQILADFSGYSDIARGVAKLLGFELMVNFNLPYFAKNPSEFWRRWHISFSTWIRDYLYIPLGGNRGGRLSTYRNLFLSMVLAGLWHGAAWTFILWGAYHGAILVVYRFLTESRPATIPHIGLLHDGKRVGQIAIMFVLTTIGWVIFRAEGVQNAIDMLTNIGLTGSRDSLSMGYDLVFFTLPLVITQLAQHRTSNLLVVLTLHRGIQILIFGFLLTWIVVFGVREQNEFLYFQF